MFHCAMFSIIALVIFNVSSLHLLRKGRLKLIVVRVWFQEQSPNFPSILTVDMDYNYTESTSLQ